MKLAQMTACKLQTLLAGGDICSVDVVRSVLDEIDRREADVQAFVTVRPKQELIAEAQTIDARRSRGEQLGPLAGIPVAIKDSICTEGLRTTCASRILSDYSPPFDATVVSRLRAADAVILGKTNMDEFAMGSSTENSAFATTRNPHHLDYVPGGTSGGSAAAVAADETILAIGSDTGGSIRQPCAFCGVVGFKPTYGLTSRYGLIAYASSLDQIGPVAKDVADTTLLLSVIAGHDPLDSTSIARDVPDYQSKLHADGALRVGVPQDYFGEGLDEEIRESVQAAIRLLEEDGHDVTPVELPHTKYALPAYYIIACAEASSNLARYDGCRYGFRAEQYTDLIDMYRATRTQGFGTEVKRRLTLGTYVLSGGYYDAYYLKAAKVRRLIAEDFERALQSCDLLVHPISPTAAFKIGEKTDDPLTMYLSDVYSVTANLAGLPAISIPCGKNRDGLPIGVQLVANRLGESTLVHAASRLERLLAQAGAWPTRD